MLAKISSLLICLAIVLSSCKKESDSKNNDKTIDGLNTKLNGIWVTSDCGIDSNSNAAIDANERLSFTDSKREFRKDFSGSDSTWSDEDSVYYLSVAFKWKFSNDGKYLLLTQLDNSGMEISTNSGNLISLSNTDLILSFAISNNANRMIWKYGKD